VNDAALSRAQIPSPSFYFLRPDGHVGICGARLEAARIESYLYERLRLRASSGGERALAA
jgi:hypothetical protein